MLSQLDHTLGNHEHERIGAIDQPLGTQGVLEGRGERNHVRGRKERKLLFQQRPDRHDKPHAATSPCQPCTNYALGLSEGRLDACSVLVACLTRK